MYVFYVNVFLHLTIKRGISARMYVHMYVRMYVLCISRELSNLLYTWRVYAGEQRMCSVEFDAIWTCDKFNIYKLSMQLCATHGWT